MTMSQSKAYSECTVAGPLIAAIIGTWISRIFSRTLVPSRKNLVEPRGREEGEAISGWADEPIHCSESSANDRYASQSSETLRRPPRVRRLASAYRTSTRAQAEPDAGPRD